MGNLLVKPSKGIRGEITVPGDKSISHRAVMIGSLARGETVIHGFLPSADCLATIGCLREMGVGIKMTNDKCQMSNECRVIINGKGLFGLEEPKKELYVGNSGTTIRLILGILAGQNFVSHITGDTSIQRRPMLRVVKPLREMGAEIDELVDSRKLNVERRKNELFAPLKIIGRELKGIQYEMPVASAQVKSAILLAGLLAEGETTVIEKHPSRDHTERMLAHFGVNIRVKGQGARVIGRQEFDGTEIDVPGDISSAAFFMVAALLTPNSELTIHNVGLNPTRTGILDILHRMGARIEVLNERIICEEPRGEIKVQSSNLKAQTIGREVIPRLIDEIPIIALAATQAEGVTEIVGAKELRVKESDRIKTVCKELRKMGAKINELEDGMLIEGSTKLYGAKINSYGDHRIAMMAAIAGLIAEGKTEIEEAACIETSFPGFEELLKKLVQQ